MRSGGRAWRLKVVWKGLVLQNPGNCVHAAYIGLKLRAECKMYSMGAATDFMAW